MSLTLQRDDQLTHRSSTSPSTRSLNTTHGSSPSRKYLATFVSRSNALINATVVACSAFWSYPLYAKYALISGRLCSIFASRGSTMDGIGIGSALAGDVVLGCELVRRENLESVPRRMTSGYWHCPPKIRFTIQVRRFVHTSAPIRQHPPHFGFPSSHLTYHSSLASLCQHCQCCRIPLTRLRLQICSNPKGNQILVARNAPDR